MAKQLTFPLQLIDRRPVAASTPAAPGPTARWPEFSWQRPNANVVVVGAAAGFAVGLLLWGFITLSVLSAVDSIVAQPERGPTAAVAAEAEVLNCASFGAVRALSPEDEARFQAQCGSTAPVSNVAPTPAPAAPVSAPAPAATTGNRANCDQIRGTQYLSGDERTWYLANCVRR